MAASVVVDHATPVTREFYKLTGSGNDFVFFDLRRSAGELGMSAEGITRLCARGTGIGADGLVSMVPDAEASLGILYWNADGSKASLCGNATLCTVRLAALLGQTGEVTIRTDAGVIAGRLVDGQPEIDLDPATRLATDQLVTVRPPYARRIGYAVVGVPHLVVLVDQVEAIDLMGDGARLRHDQALGPEGANVNFVSADGRMRTYERGVEGETLACGTGAVATAALLVAWGLATPPVRLQARGGVLSVRFTGDRPSLSGEGRLVFTGRLP